MENSTGNLGFSSGLIQKLGEIILVLCLSYSDFKLTQLNDEKSTNLLRVNLRQSLSLHWEYSVLIFIE